MTRVLTTIVAGWPGSCPQQLRLRDVECLIVLLNLSALHECAGLSAHILTVRSFGILVKTCLVTVARQWVDFVRRIGARVSGGAAARRDTRKVNQGHLEIIRKDAAKNNRPASTEPGLKTFTQGAEMKQYS